MGERIADNRVDGLLFRKWRKEAGLSLREFCREFRRRTGISLADSNLSAMEQGHRRIREEVIEGGAEIIGKSPIDFPEYRLRHMPEKALTDPMADRLFRHLYRFDELTDQEMRELLGSSMMLDFMEKARSYRADRDDSTEGKGGVSREEAGPEADDRNRRG